VLGEFHVEDEKDPQNLIITTCGDVILVEEGTIKYISTLSRAKG